MVLFYILSLVTNFFCEMRVIDVKHTEKGLFVSNQTLTLMKITTTSSCSITSNQKSKQTGKLLQSTCKCQLLKTILKVKKKA